MASHNNRNLELPEVGSLQIFHGANGHVIRTFTANGIVRCRINTIKADLDIEVIHSRKTPCFFFVNECTVCTELHADSISNRILK